MAAERMPPPEKARTTKSSLAFPRGVQCRTTSADADDGTVISSFQLREAQPKRKTRLSVAAAIRTCLDTFDR